MNMKPVRTLAIALSMLCVSASLGAAEPAKITIAAVNLDVAYNQIGYDMFPSLTLDEETKSTLAKIRAEKAKLQQDLLKATDEIGLRKISENLQFLNNKEQAIRSSLGRSRGGMDYRQVLGRFVKDRFGKKYPIIINAGYGDWKRQAIQFDVQEVDITDEVVDAFLKDLNAK